MLFLLMSLISQALEHYEDLADIKRVIVHTNLFNADVRYTGLVYAYHWIVADIVSSSGSSTISAS